MNNEDIFMAVGDADDALLDDAIIKRSYGKRRALRIAGIAAAAVLAAGCTALIAVKLRIKAPDITANNDPTASPAAATASAPTPAPTPTPLPTPEPTPLLDLTGWNVVTGEGVAGVDGQERIPWGGYVGIDEAVQIELDKDENDDALFKVEICNMWPLSKFPYEEHERILAELQELCREEDRLCSNETYQEFYEEFEIWFANVYYPWCPYKDMPPPLPGMDEEAWHLWYEFLGFTIFKEGFPNYFDLFLTYLDEQGEYEKVQRYRPVAEECWDASYRCENWYSQELVDVVYEDFERLIDAGYRIDLESFNYRHYTCEAYLTKEQIMDFDADEGFAYQIAFSFAWLDKDF